MNIDPRKLGSILAISGAILQLGVIAVLLKVVPSLYSAFSTLGTSGIGDPTTLLGGFSEVFAGSTVGLVLGFVGLGLLCIALTTLRYRANWFFWFLLFYGVVLLVALPVGTIFGVFFFIYLGIHRREFSAPSSPTLTD